MTVEILTPDRQVFSGEATSVLVPGTQGRFEMLKDHAPLISSLQAGKVRVKTDSDTHHFPIKKGFVEVLNNKIAILVEEEREETGNKE